MHGKPAYIFSIGRQLMSSYILLGVQILTSIVIGAMGYFLKGIKDDITKSISKQDERVTRLEEEVHRMPGIYVLKSDYQNNIRNSDQKFDKVDEKLNRVDDKLDRIIKSLMDGREQK
jgi:peptidoglycan hydrolase CwlO-like protein